MIKEGVGKHSDGSKGVFWRTLFLSVVKWGVIALVGIGAAVLGWRLSNRDSAQPPPSDNPAMIGSEETPKSRSPDGPAGEPPASQILNGAGNQQAMDSARKKLEGAGYEILTTGNAARPYDKTTVFYQEGRRSEADELARLVEATVIEAAPDNLDKEIPLTLVIGADFKP